MQFRRSKRHRTKHGPNFFYEKMNVLDLCKRIEADEVFSFARYGDGEFHWLVGKPGFVNRSGHMTFEDGSRALRQTLLDYGKDGKLKGKQPPFLLGGPTFFYGYGNEERKKRFGWYEEWIREHGLTHLHWVSNLVFTGSSQRAAEAREVYALLAVLRKKHVVIVGPPWLERLPPSVLGTAYKKYIRVPPHNCWLCKDRIKRHILEYWTATTERPIFFSLSCAYTANILVHELADSVGKDSWLVDVGSLWDPYAGYHQRGYHSAIRDAGGAVT